MIGGVVDPGEADEATVAFNPSHLIPIFAFFFFQPETTIDFNIYAKKYQGG